MLIDISKYFKFILTKNLMSKKVAYFIFKKNFMDIRKLERK